jgi:hypothetical protein
MCGCADVRMCENVRICRCADVWICRCADGEGGSGKVKAESEGLNCKKLKSGKPDVFKLSGFLVLWRRLRFGCGRAVFRRYCECAF